MFGHTDTDTPKHTHINTLSLTPTHAHTHTDAVQFPQGQDYDEFLGQFELSSEANQSESDEDSCNYVHMRRYTYIRANMQR